MLKTPDFSPLLFTYPLSPPQLSDKKNPGVIFEMKITPGLFLLTILI